MCLADLSDDFLQGGGAALDFRLEGMKTSRDQSLLMLRLHAFGAI